MLRLFTSTPHDGLVEVVEAPGQHDDVVDVQPAGHHRRRYAHSLKPEVETLDNPLPDTQGRNFRQITP